MRCFWIPLFALLGAGCSSEADKLEGKAATGDVSAQFDLATLFESPDEGEPNLVQAYKWYAIASTNGDVAAGEFLQDCSDNMSAKQIAAAQKLVAAWMKTHPPKVTGKEPETKPKEKPKRLSPQERVATAVREELGKPKTAPITLADWQKVKVLNLASRQLRDISALTQCTALREVDLGRNGLSNLAPLANLTKLEKILAYENRIADLKPLANITQLRELQVSANSAINDLQPLTDLTQLEVLELEGCAVTSLAPLARNTRLRRLVITSSKVTDVTPLHGLKNLRFLSIKHCPIPPAQAAALRKALPNCKIFGP